VAIARQIIGAQLVTHDEQNILNFFAHFKSKKYGYA
jgi:hypothetical protein